MPPKKTLWNFIKDGYSVKQIARLYDAPESTIRYWLRRRRVPVSLRAAIRKNAVKKPWSGFERETIYFIKHPIETFCGFIGGVDFSSSRGSTSSYADARRLQELGYSVTEGKTK